MLGVAHSHLPLEKYPDGFRFTTEPEANFPLDQLTFLGLISLNDPPRPAVPNAVEKCREAGIRVALHSAIPVA